MVSIERKYKSRYLFDNDQTEKVHTNSIPGRKENKQTENIRKNKVNRKNKNNNKNNNKNKNKK
ncbi:hypothetical protein [Methanolobus sp. WCC5]|uniref:hypothetical protein n=1 Tax=Methanolobus sp. WCC5 TaxID=3125785 RepID=UPI003248495E